jgi:hypothetical protein
LVYFKHHHHHHHHHHHLIGIVSIGRSPSHAWHQGAQLRCGLR